MVGPYDLTRHGGKTVDWITHRALLQVEANLGYSLSVVQGSYRGSRGASASAGTHDRGGVVDLTAWDHARKVRALRVVGFAAWYRPALRGVWPAHIHAVLIGNQKLPWLAADQVQDYKNHRNGLRGHAHDPTWHPSPIPTFRWNAPPATQNRSKRPVVDMSNAVRAFKHEGSLGTGKVIKRAIAAEVGKGIMDLDSLRLGKEARNRYALVQRKFLREKGRTVGSTGADGIPGRESMMWLGQRHGFGVRD